jgi:hypothetical protein
LLWICAALADDSDQDIPEPFRGNNSISEAGALNFRATAVQAAQQLIECSPEDYSRIFDLLYTRLAALVVINATALAAREAKILDDFNTSPTYRNPNTGIHLAPWNLRILVVRLQSVGFNDWRRGIMGIYDLAREARARTTTAGDNKQLWDDRLMDLSVRTAGTLVEMGDIEGAIRHSRGLLSTTKGDGAVYLKSTLALLYIRCGLLDEAQELISSLGDGNIDYARLSLLALQSMAAGDYQDAESRWKALENGPSPELVAQNRAVCLVYQGKMQEVRNPSPSCM